MSFVASPASAELLERGTYDFSYGPEVTSFCGFPIEQVGGGTATYTLVERGDGFAYYRDHNTFTDTLTNVETGEFVTWTGVGNARDHTMTIAPDGTFSLTAQNQGTSVFLDAAANLLGRTAGMHRTLIRFDANGNFLDAEVLLQGGRSVDFCAILDAAIG